jgi:hypothetical protein
MTSGRIITAGDASLGEPEQDANSALTELDKGTAYFYLKFTVNISLKNLQD